MARPHISGILKSQNLEFACKAQKSIHLFHKQRTSYQFYGETLTLAEGRELIGLRPTHPKFQGPSAETI